MDDVLLKQLLTWTVKFEIVMSWKATFSLSRSKFSSQRWSPALRLQITEWWVTGLSLRDTVRRSEGT